MNSEGTHPYIYMYPFFSQPCSHPDLADPIVESLLHNALLLYYLLSQIPSFFFFFSESFSLPWWLVWPPLLLQTAFRNSQPVQQSSWRGSWVGGLSSCLPPARRDASFQGIFLPPLTLSFGFVQRCRDPHLIGFWHSFLLTHFLKKLSMRLACSVAESNILAFQDISTQMRMLHFNTRRKDKIT